MNADTAQSPEIKKTWKPIVAGILDIISAIFGAFLIFSYLSCVSNFTGQPPGAYALSFAIVPAAIFCMTFIGGIYALKRRRFGLALAGSITASMILGSGIVAGLDMLLERFMNPYLIFGHESVYQAISYLTMVLGIPPIILTAMSKKEFE